MLKFLLIYLSLHTNILLAHNEFNNYDEKYTCTMLVSYDDNGTGKTEEVGLLAHGATEEDATAKVLEKSVVIGFTKRNFKELWETKQCFKNYIKD